MSGATSGASLYFLAAFGVVGAATDLARGRIYNWLTAGMMLSGVMFALADGGWMGGLNALLGIAAGLALYGWMFPLGVLGGGDVKFLMGFGAWGGPRFALEAALLGVLLGGAFSLGVLLVRGKLPDFLRRMRHFALTITVKELEPELPRLDRRQTLPFGIPIAIAAIWTACASPLAHWGMLPWG